MELNESVIANRINFREGSKSQRSHSVTPRKNKMRPQTPHIDLLEIREIKQVDSNQLTKNFQNLMKQIVETNNENFLRGDVNVIEYILSKYTNMSIEEVKKLEKLSMKVNAETGLLNQFGQYLPNLKELKLNFCNIPSINDIGSSFEKLIVLNVSDCNLKDLSGKYYLLIL
jgi:hypothetical protein